MKEDVLLDRALDGDESAFELLLRPHRRGMLNIAYQMCLDWEEAREICQDALFKIFKYLHSFKQDRVFKTWLYRITMNTALDTLKKRSTQAKIVDQKSVFCAPGEEMNPENIFLSKELKERIMRCLRSLTPREKSVFLLRDSEGFSIRETAEILGFSSSSIRTHLSRARKKIRAQLEK
jgi:RNA polymerase sigma-70 factor (ECF subfamily)